MGCSHVRKKMSHYLKGYGPLNGNTFAISEHCFDKTTRDGDNNNNNNNNFALLTDDITRKYVMHEVFNRCSRRDINIDGTSYKICLTSKTYMNRHLIYPEEAKKNYFYKVDVCAKTRKYHGEWVELIGWKWITKTSRLTWYCRLCSSGKYMHTYFIDATTCTNSSQDLSGFFDKIKLT